MRQLWGTLVVLGLVRAASAQSTPPNDEAIDIQLFQYSIGPKSFFTVDSGDIASKKQLAMDAVITFMTNPLSVYVDQNNSLMTPARDNVVKQVTAMQLTAAYGLTDKLQIGANLPLIFDLSGDGLDPTTGMHGAAPLQVTGLGDLIVEGKYKLYDRGALRFSGIGGVSLPTSFGSDGSRFIGDNLPTLRARGALQWTSGKLSLGADLGFVLRDPRTIYASTIGPQWVFGAAASVAVTDRFYLIGETYGRTGLVTFALDESPIEAIAGLRVIAVPSVAVTLGGGAGIDRAIGAPNARFFGSVGYAPDVRDSDGDGIPNARDKCPLVPEDKDGFQDEDGCPDDDNDSDGIPDSEDKCPNQAEDHDGFQDEDGCPDLDNDKDGIPDLEDKCPNDPEDGKEPFPHDGCPADKRDSDGDGIPDAFDKCPTEEEDFDGFEDGDGCPDLDNDKDGVPDAQDKCPVCPEDKDGFQDEDGCPDLDNDHDGIPDSQDTCPNDPETVNGIKDDDGCPDAGGKTLVTLDGDRLVVDKMPAAASDQVVEQMQLVMAGHSEVTKWLVAIALPNKAAAQKLGDAIKARLDKWGVKGVDILAAAGPAKIGAIVQERADANAPFVCPAGMEVHGRPEAEAKPKTAGAGSSTPPTTAPATVPAPKPAPVSQPAPAPAPVAAPTPPPPPPAAKKPDAKKPEPKKPDAKKDKKDEPEIEMDPGDSLP